MKNLHIIATDKPSGLFKVSDELKLTRKFDFYNGAIYQNIYITSDEEINQQTKPCWCINTIKNTWDADLIYYQGSMPQYHYKGFKKIILTTDQDLIADGVQIIDDEFLEWFIKNPSCEEVEVESNKCLVKRGQCSCSYQDIDCQCLGYKIIIPKEELNLNCFDCNKSLQDCTCMEDTIDMKQETLEEAAERLFPDSSIQKRIFKMGANYQAERMYSEEEVLNILYKHTEDMLAGKKVTLKEWFTEFKKK